jgi:hypothetical protein
MLDEQLRFGWDEWTCNHPGPEGAYTKGVTYRKPYARRVADEEGYESISNYGRSMYDLLDCADYDRYDEDEEGYVNFPYLGGMVWLAEPLTESQIDKILEDAV